MIPKPPLEGSRTKSSTSRQYLSKIVEFQTDKLQKHSLAALPAKNKRKNTIMSSWKGVEVPSLGAPTSLLKSGSNARRSVVFERLVPAKEAVPRRSCLRRSTGDRSVGLYEGHSVSCWSPETTDHWSPVCGFVFIGLLSHQKPLRKPL